VTVTAFIARPTACCFAGNNPCIGRRPTTQPAATSMTRNGQQRTKSPTATHLLSATHPPDNSDVCHVAERFCCCVTAAAAAACLIASQLLVVRF